MFPFYLLNDNRRKGPSRAAVACCLLSDAHRFSHLAHMKLKENKRGDPPSASHTLDVVSEKVIGTALFLSLFLSLNIFHLVPPSSHTRSLRLCGDCFKASNDRFVT